LNFFWWRILQYLCWWCHNTHFQGLKPHCHQCYIIVASKHLQLIPRPLEYTFLSWPTNPIVSDWHEIKIYILNSKLFCLLCSQWLFLVTGNDHWEHNEPKRLLERSLDEVFIHHGWAITSNAVTPKGAISLSLISWVLINISFFHTHYFKVTKFHLSKYCLHWKVYTCEMIILIQKKKVFVRK
jgi:hypothetical protein